MRKYTTPSTEALRGIDVRSNKRQSAITTVKNMKAQMVGFYLQGADSAIIAAIFGLSSLYVNMVIRDYFGK